MSVVAVDALPQAPPPPNQPNPPPAAPPKPATPPKQPAAQQPSPTEPVELPPVDPKWLDRLPKDDREAIDVLRGYAPPPAADDLKWIESDKLDWARFKGKVLVVQSWTTGDSAGRGWPMRVANALKEIDQNEFQIVALHTPENAEGAEDFMKRQKPPQGVVVAVDPSGQTCDALGIYKQPVNFVIDRNGVVRFTGLNLNGLKSAVAELVKEPFDRKVVAPQRPQETVADETSAPGSYPPIKGPARGAADFRGKRAPDLVFESWFSNQLSPAGRTAIITFWQANVDGCFASHALLDALHREFGEHAAVIALSADSRSHFEEEALQKRLNKSDFEYGVALDRNQVMADAMKVAAVPYSIVVSKDWIVRWQGPTNTLVPKVVQQVIDADAASPPAGQPGAPGKRRGWVQPH